MEFTNEFSVKAPQDEVWNFVLDAERVTPCVPGAQLTEKVSDNHYKGTMKVKLGPVQMTYRGEVEISPDEASNTITMRAKGTEVRGTGGANGTVTTRLSPSADGGTDLHIQSQVEVSGRVAQFGRGIMQDVANRLIKEFAQCIEQKLQPGGPSEVEPETVTQEVARTAPSPGQAAQPVPQAPSTFASAAATPPVAAGSTGGSTYQPPANLNAGKLLLDVTRSRLAQLLRDVANMLEPK